MKIKEQTRKQAVGYSKHCFEVVDRPDEVSNHTYGKAKLTWFEEIFEEYHLYLSYEYDIRKRASPIVEMLACFMSRGQFFPASNTFTVDKDLYIEISIIKNCINR